MEAIVLAGGRGTRLSGVVPHLPKPLAPIAGRPFLSYLLTMLADQGCTRICLSTGYLAETIEQQYGASFQGMGIVYARETSPLGTGGAIKAALAMTTGQEVFVVNGDTLAGIDLRRMLAQHTSTGSMLTIALMQVPDTARYGAVTTHEGLVAAFSEKGMTGPGYINAGVYLMKCGIFEPFALPESFSFERDVLMAHASTLQTRAFLSSGYFIDIGVPKDYARAQVELPEIVALRG